MDSKKSNFQLVVASLLLAIFMSTMDNTIVATAMGTIVGELGDWTNSFGSPPPTWSHIWPECPSSENCRTCTGENVSLSSVLPSS